MKRAVFLDRDGVVNHAIVREGLPYSPRTLSEVKIIDGIAEQISKLRLLGWLCIVVTNQPEVARGNVSMDSVEQINNLLRTQLDLDDVFVCPHDDSDVCNCRKPNPGALLTAASKYKLSLKDSYMVGDRWSDVEAGLRAGCRTIFVDYGYVEKQPLNYTLKVSHPTKALSHILRITE